MGARAALTGGGAALTALQVPLMESFRSGDFGKFVRLSGVCDRFASATFDPPVEGYVRRMLWALAADGVIPEDARSEEHTSELQSQSNLVCRLLLEKKKIRTTRSGRPPPTARTSGPPRTRQRARRSGIISK